MHGHYHAIARTHYHSSIFHHVLWLCCWVRDCCQQIHHFPSILPFLSYSLSLWQIIGSSKVAIPNCLYTHNSSPSIQATVHPSILPPSHSFLLFSFSLSLHPVSLVVVYYSDSHSHISTLSATLWQAVIEKGARAHTHAEGQNPNKLLSDLWQLLSVKNGSCCCFITISTVFFITFIFPKTDLLFLYLLFVSLCMYRGDWVHTGLALCPEGCVEVYMYRIDWKKKVPWCIMFQQLTLGNSSLMDSAHFF